MRRKTESHLGCRRVLTLFFSLSLFFGALEQTCSAAEQPEFVATQIHEASTPVFGLAWGDFDPCHNGMEIACLLQYGSVLELAPNHPNWAPASIHDGNTDGFAMSGRPTISIGNVHSTYPGNGIVTCAGAGSSQVTVVFYDPATGWSNEVLFDNTGMVGGSWGARAGDYDPCHPDEEVFHIYEGAMDTSSGKIFREVEGSWQWEVIYGDGEWVEVGMDSAVGDFNTDHLGLEIVVVTEMGPTYEIIAPDGAGGGNWPKRTIWDDSPNSGWVVEIADVDPCHPGNELIYGTRYNNRILMSRHNGANPHDLEILFTGDATEHPYNMWDIAVGDVLPVDPGLEILGVDETGSVYLVRRIEDSWQGQVIWQDLNSLHAVIAGDFLPARSGDEILVAGESGTITLLTLTFTDNLTGDGKVDFQDFAEVANYYRESEASADIGPWPIGDGIVDMRDVAILAENWLQTAYWVE